MYVWVRVPKCSIVEEGKIFSGKLLGLGRDRMHWNTKFQLRVGLGIHGGGNWPRVEVQSGWVGLNLARVGVEPSLGRSQTLATDLNVSWSHKQI